METVSELSKLVGILDSQIANILTQEILDNAIKDRIPLYDIIGALQEIFIAPNLSKEQYFVIYQLSTLPLLKELIGNIITYEFSYFIKDRATMALFQQMLLICDDRKMSILQIQSKIDISLAIRSLIGCKCMDPTETDMDIKNKLKTIKRTILTDLVLNKYSIPILILTKVCLDLNIYNSIRSFIILHVLPQELRYSLHKIYHIMLSFSKSAEFIKYKDEIDNITNILYELSFDLICLQNGLLTALDTINCWPKLTFPWPLSFKLQESQYDSIKISYLSSMENDYIRLQHRNLLRSILAIIYLDLKGSAALSSQLRNILTAIADTNRNLENYMGFIITVFMNYFCNNDPNMSMWNKVMKPNIFPILFAITKVYSYDELNYGVRNFILVPQCNNIKISHIVFSNAEILNAVNSAMLYSVVQYENNTLFHRTVVSTIFVLYLYANLLSPNSVVHCATREFVVFNITKIISHIDLTLEYLSHSLLLNPRATPFGKFTIFNSELVIRMSTKTADSSNIHTNIMKANYILFYGLISLADHLPYDIWSALILAIKKIEHYNSSIFTHNLLSTMVNAFALDTEPTELKCNYQYLKRDCQIHIFCPGFFYPKFLTKYLKTMEMTEC